MRTSIFELSENHRVLFQAMCDDESDVLTQLAFQMSQAALEDKVEAYGVMIRTFEQQIAARKLDIAELTAKNKREEDKLLFLKETLKATILEFGIMRKTPSNMDAYDYSMGNVKVTLQPTQSVSIPDDFLNEKYGSYKVELTGLTKEQLNAVNVALHNRPMKSEFVPDKKAIKAALDSGKVIEDAEIVTNYSIKQGFK